MSGRVDPSIDSNGKGPAQQYEVTQPDDRLGPLRKDSQENNSDQESVYHSIYDESSSTLSRSVVVTEHASTSARLISTTGTNTVTQLTEGMNRLEVVEHNRTMVNTVQINERSVVQSRPAAEPSMFSGATGTTISGGTHNVAGGHVNEDKRQNVFERGGIFFQHCTFATTPGETVAGLSTVTGQTHHLPNIGHNANQTPAQLPESSEYARVSNQPQFQPNDDRQHMKDRQYEHQEGRQGQEIRDHQWGVNQEYGNRVDEDRQRRDGTESQQSRAPVAISPDYAASVIQQAQTSSSIVVSPVADILSGLALDNEETTHATVQSPSRSRISFKLPSVVSTTWSNLSDSRYKSLRHFNRMYLSKLEDSKSHVHIRRLMSAEMSQFVQSKYDVPLWKFDCGLATYSGSPPRPFRDIDIGDVGILDADGGFDTLFNVLDSPEANANARLQLPKQGFEPFQRSDLKTSKTRVNQTIAAGSVYIDDGVYVVSDDNDPESDSFSVKICSSGPEGSAIIIPEAGKVVMLPVLLDTRAFYPDILQYVAKHAPSWYQHVNAVQQRQLRNGDLILVASTYTAPYRGLITFKNKNRKSPVTPFTAKFHRPSGSTRYRWHVEATDEYSFLHADVPDSGTASPTFHCFAIQPLSIFCTSKHFNNMKC